MLIAEVQSFDELTAEQLMINVINTSVRADDAEKTAFIANVQKNLRLAINSPTECVHLKCVINQAIVGVVLVRKFGNLCSLFVDPQVHGMGIGRALLNEAIKQCAMKSDVPYVRVNAAANAVGFYEVMGFKALEDQHGRDSSTAMDLAIQPLKKVVAS
ncbi:GNAT family N-acetyltransferase [Paraburkholderia dilworthii]|uniref:GNAT family N-acetyltransferase n=1 Tax=Paraburkholderia dilworthii TaxID=948106 RepID=UPI000404F8A5|nr:GNAT family N-acetyltransferase [Paraburkholderia dilworthii]